MFMRIINAVRNHGPKRIFLRAIYKLIQFFRINFYKFLSDNSPVGKGAILNQPLLLSGKGCIELNKCYVGVWPSPFYFSSYTHIEARSVDASVVVGSGTWLNNNGVIIADRKSITIGSNVLIGHNFFICDSDFHSLKPSDRTNGNYDTAPVCIEDNVFIGANTTILKGVTIGENAVIAAGSVVTSDVPKDTIFGGIPAKFLKNLSSM